MPSQVPSRVGTKTSPICLQYLNPLSHLAMKRVTGNINIAGNVTHI